MKYTSSPWGMYTAGCQYITLLSIWYVDKKDFDRAVKKCTDPPD